MKTVVIGPRPAALDDVIARRHALGQDLFDEIWERDYHMAPAPHPWHGYVSNQLARALAAAADRAGLCWTDPFNLSEPADFRVPDAGLHCTLPDETFVATAALVIEVVSPGDESWDKLGLYAAHRVDELLIVDPGARSVAMLALAGDGYQPVEVSALLAVTVNELVTAVDSPGERPD